MLPKSTERSLSLALTFSALALTFPHTALSASTDSLESLESLPPGTYDLTVIKDADENSRNHKANNRDYYTNQYGDLDTIDNKRKSRSGRSEAKMHRRNNIYTGVAGRTNLYQEELRQLDRNLREDIREELTYSPFVDEEKIHVKVRRGVATLTGTVEDRDAMIAAVENAYEGGARKVKNRLLVSRYEERPWVDMSDGRLEKEIYSDLENGISVDVLDGVATLTGTVRERSAIADAVEIAYEAGARRVVNRLRLY